MRSSHYNLIGISLCVIGGITYGAGMPGLGVLTIAIGTFLFIFSIPPNPRPRPTVFPSEPKTTCVSCGAQILQTTADRTDGYCMPCFQRAPIEERRIDPWSLPSRCSKRGFDPDNRESFLELCDLIAPEDPKLKERVCYSVDDADEFAIANRKYLGRDAYWFPFEVVTDWMEDHGMLIGLDHNCEFEDIAWAVNKLMHAHGKEFQFVVQADSGSRPTDQLTVVNKAGKKSAKWVMCWPRSIQEIRSNYLPCQKRNSTSFEQR